jgi:hypothetical protein
MSGLIQLLWIFDMVGSTLGVITNTLLIVAIFRASKQKLQSYSYMFLFTAIFDLGFSALEIMIQHVGLNELVVETSVF